VRAVRRALASRRSCQLPPFLREFEDALGSTDRRALDGSVGLKPAFCGSCRRRRRKTFGASHICRKSFTTEVSGSAPMIAPPVLWVDW